MIDDALDPRQRRTLRALRETILELAREQPAQSITMTELARRAELHRSTIYQHVSSPAALLVQTLQAELDEVRLLHLGDVPADGLAHATRQVVLAVLAHLERHQAIYARELLDPGGPLHAMLRQHFATSVGGLMEQLRLGPALDDPQQRALFNTAAPRWIAEGSVGAMAEWLLRPPPRRAEDYLAVHQAMLPAWWPSAD